MTPGRLVFGLVNALWSVESSDILVWCLEFSRHSISQRNAYNDSSAKSLSWTITFNARLTGRIRGVDNPLNMTMT